MAVVLEEITVIVNPVGIGFRAKPVILVMVTVIGQCGLQRIALREGMLVEKAGGDDVGTVLDTRPVGELSGDLLSQRSLSPAVGPLVAACGIGMRDDIVPSCRHPPELELAKEIGSRQALPPIRPFRVSGVPLCPFQAGLLIVRIIGHGPSVKGITLIADLEITDTKTSPPREVMSCGHLPEEEGVRPLAQLDVDNLLIALLQVACLGDLDHLDGLDLLRVDRRDATMVAVTVDQDQRSLPVGHRDGSRPDVGIEPWYLPECDEGVSTALRLLGEMEDLARGGPLDEVRPVAGDGHPLEVDPGLGRQEEVRPLVARLDLERALEGVVTRQEHRHPVAAPGEPIDPEPPLGIRQRHRRQRVARAQQQAGIVVVFS